MFSLFFISPPILAQSFSSLSDRKPQGSINFLEALFTSSPIVQATFLILLVMSIVAWAVIFQKGALFKRIKKEVTTFDDVFLKYHSFEAIYNLARSHEHNPLANIFHAGYNEMRKFLNPEKATDFLGGDDNIERALRKEIQIELSRLESGLGLSGNSRQQLSLLSGFFGTVFGIMDSFSKIATTGSASLTVVAPGIAEALLATGLGLFAAIPASIFYNSYINKLKLFEMEFNNFALDFINIAKRNFFQAK